MGGSDPKYSPEAVEATILIEVVEQHPLPLTVGELVARIVSDPGDRREVATAIEAVRSLERSLLVRVSGDEELVAPTRAAIHAHSLLA